MMSKMPDLPEYTFTVSTEGFDGMQRDDKVEAAYFQESGQYTVLKDATHVPVSAFKTATVLQIKRSAEPLDFD